MSLKKRVTTYKSKVGRPIKYGTTSSVVIKKPVQKRHKKGKPALRSGFEEEFWKAQHKFISLKYEPFRLTYTIMEERTYLPDFVDMDYLRRHDRVKVYETKGFFKPTDRKKMLAIKKSNPDLWIIMVFQRDNYLSKSKAARYSDWCKKHGFDYCIGTDLTKTVHASNPNREESKPTRFGNF